MTAVYVAEVNACDSKPCLNGGTCTSTDYINYQCSCSMDFSGKNCEIGKMFSLLIKNFVAIIYYSSNKIRNMLLFSDLLRGM